jgi:flavoprotein
MKIKVPKEEVVKVMVELRAKYSNEELAVMLSKTTQSIWRWQNPLNSSVPDKANYEVLKRLTVK